MPDPVSIGLSIGSLIAGVAIEFLRTRNTRRTLAARSLALDTVIAGIEVLGRDPERAHLAQSLKTQIQQLALLNGVEHTTLYPAVQDIVDQLEDYGVFEILEREQRTQRAAKAVEAWHKHTPPTVAALTLLLLILITGAVAGCNAVAPGDPIRQSASDGRVFYVHQWPADAPADPLLYRSFDQDGRMVTVVPTGT